MILTSLLLMKPSLKVILSLISRITPLRARTDQEGKALTVLKQINGIWLYTMLISLLLITANPHTERAEQILAT